LRSGWLVVEDLLTVLVLVMMPAVFARSASDASVAASLALAAVKVAVLTALILVGGRRVVPWVLTRIAATRSRELFTLTVLALALGISVASAELFGVSMALGGLFAGLVVGRSEFSVRAASEALPMRDAFAVNVLRVRRHAARSGVRRERPLAHPLGARRRARRQAARRTGPRAPLGVSGRRRAAHRRGARTNR
jgi:predicted Kef-type K+ transport protein